MTQYEWGDVIRKERLKRGWSQKGLAERVGISGPLLSRIENGKEPKNAMKAIGRIAEVLKIQVDG